MLYAMQDAAAKALVPVSALAELGNRITQALVPPFAPFRRETQASLRLLTRLTMPFPKPCFSIASVNVDGQAVAVTEEVVESLPFCELRHFVKEGANPGPKLLIVAPLSGHHATLLRSTVHTMLEHHDVYITDWVDARQVPLSRGKFDLSDFTAYVQGFIRKLGPDVHVLAVCQPCVPALAAVGLMEQRQEEFAPKTLTLIAGPVDARSSPTEVNRFAAGRDIRFFEDKMIERVPYGYPGATRKVYPGFKQLACFVMMNKDKHLQAYVDFFRDVRAGDELNADKHEVFYDEYNAVLDLPAEFYLETLEKVFLRPQLALGELELCGERTDMSAVQRTALLTIEGDKDDITGLGQTHAAQALCSSLPEDKRQVVTVEGVGHYGAFSGSKFKASTAPMIAEFIRKHA